MLLPLPGATTAGGPQPTVTLTDLALVQQLYATVSALSVLPSGRACTADRGPHYTLTFLQGTATLMTLEADRDGCGPVIIAGETPIREATSAFWQQLDQAIVLATPPLNPDRLAIATAPRAGQAPQTALITSASTAKQLYDAILTLPQSNTAPSCPSEPEPTYYQMVFFEDEHAVPATVNVGCWMVEVDGGFQWRGGWFSMNDQFRGLLQSVLARASFAPAQPDHLAVAVNTPQTVTPYVNVNDHQLMLALFNQVFRLPETTPQPGCPPDSDKLAGSFTDAALTFTQWNLPLGQIDAYQGTCRYLELEDTGQRLQGDQGFWDLVNRALAK
jgi:hypothetical protein